MKKHHPLSDLDADIHDHIDRETQDNIERGMAPEEARYAALRNFGNVAMAKEDTRAVWIPVWLSQLRQDLRYAGWMLRRSPGFTAVAVFSIALGIGATAAMFTLVDQVLLRALPVRDPHELVQVTFTGLRYGNNWGDTEVSYPMYEEIRDHNEMFSGVFGRFGAPFHIGSTGSTERVAGEIVSGTYFPVLGVDAAIGRTLTPDDDRMPGAHPVAVLSHAFWTNRFAANPAILNSTISINGHPYIIVGVAREGFDGVELGRQTQVFVSMMMKGQLTPGWNALDERLWRWVRVFARQPSGTTRQQVQAALNPYFDTLLNRDLADRGFASASRNTRDEYARNRLVIADASQGQSGLRRALATPLWVLMAAAGVVLLIACANVANLLIVRGVARQREMAVRLALGATRRRLVSQLLVESSMLALVGGLLGLAIAAVTAPVVLSFFVTPEGPRPFTTTPDWRILAFTFGMSGMTGVLFGLAPAFQATRADVAPSLKEHATSVLGGRAYLHRTLVAAQLGLSLLLLVGAAVFTRTLDNRLDVDLGFETSRLISFSMDPSLNSYEPHRSRQFAATLLERLRSTPGVEAAGLATMRLLEGSRWSTNMTVEGSQGRPPQSAVFSANSISPGFFNAMGIPLLLGRDFTERDMLAATPVPRDPAFRVAIVNERFARHFFGDALAVGKHLGFGGDPNTPTPIEIIGVVKDSKYADVRDATPPQVFFPFFEMSLPNAFTVYLRTSGPPDGMFNAIRQTVRHIDPNLPIHTTRTLERQVAQSLRRERLVATMTGTFGVLATALALIGLYGVMSYSVARRTQEIGLRIAIGASASSIRRLVIGEAATIALAGTVVALPTTWWLGRFISAELYGVNVFDPIVIAGATCVLGGVVLLAALIPATRAARLDPTIALRQV